ncbi:MAG TPA: ABC transporter ATP-binding protein [Planctomycetaceae bacterium]|nr:ABC transporter ATP-binding protein [Planctomycetaceae bacterium]
MIEIESITKSYEGRQVLQPTTLHIDRGQTSVLIGPSGCGKSTLLRIIIGLIEADSGEVRFEGVPLTPDSVLQARHRMGYVLQDGGLFPHLSIFDNVALLARHLGTLTENDIRTRVKELADLTKLPSDALSRYPQQVSGGQRQRVAIMRALMLDPPLLLLDEPMGALDPLVRYELQEDLKSIFAELNKTVVLVTHDMGEAAFFGEDCILMANGRIIQRGSIDEFHSEPAEDFVTQFITAQRFPALRT